MSEKAPTTAPIFSRDTAADVPAEALDTPHFLDAAVVEHAQPAVPLSDIRRKRSWPTHIILMALLFGLAVGAFGSMLFMRERNISTQAQAKADAAAATEQTARQQDAAQADSAETPQTELGSPEAAVQKTRAGRTAVARENRNELSANDVREAVEPSIEVAPRGEDAAALRGALGDWVEATNARDINRQMSFYNPTVNSFYRARNASREEVRAEKARVFERASSIDIRAADPTIRVSPDGNTATMRFRKSYQIAGGGQDRRGTVLQELKWKRVNGQWRIVSERDLKVLER